MVREMGEYVLEVDEVLGLSFLENNNNNNKMK